MASRQLRYGTARHKRFASQSGAWQRFFQGFQKVTPALLCGRPDGQKPTVSE